MTTTRARIAEIRVGVDSPLIADEISELIGHRQAIKELLVAIDERDALLSESWDELEACAETDGTLQGRIKAVTGAGSDATWTKESALALTTTLGIAVLDLSDELGAASSVVMRALVEMMCSLEQTGIDGILSRAHSELERWTKENADGT